MRAHGREGRIGQRFAFVIGVAAAGVMALGAQTAAAAVVKYDTKLTITADRGHVNGDVYSGPWRCERRRQVVLFKPQPGADRKVGKTRTHLRHGHGEWAVTKSSLGLQPGRHRLYAVVKPKRGVPRDPHTGFYCRAARSVTRVIGVMALGAQTVAAGVVHYDTKLTITHEGHVGTLGQLWHGKVLSDSDHNPGYDPANWVTKCMDGRRVVLFKQRPGADRRLGSDRSGGRNGAHGTWGVRVHRDLGNRVYARVKSKVRDRYVCRDDLALFHH
jgi:hypothetical protein